MRRCTARLRIVKMNTTDFNVLSRFIYTRYLSLSRNIMILIKRTKMKENARHSDKWNSLLPREKRKSSLSQCSCTRHVYWLGTHKERHFVLVLFLPDPRMRQDEDGPLNVSWRESCVFHGVTPSFPSSLLFRLFSKMAKINAPQKIAFFEDL